ncbi:hypothetical protein KY308_02995 [Candidatus Woesearchaeota archaeon]|nr:hypothetical protein [Candidatus Woesearchaeota archaeon]
MIPPPSRFEQVYKILGKKVNVEIRIYQKINGPQHCYHAEVKYTPPEMPVLGRQSPKVLDVVLNGPGMNKAIKKIGNQIGADISLLLKQENERKTSQKHFGLKNTGFKDIPTSIYHPGTGRNIKNNFRDF